MELINVSLDAFQGPLDLLLHLIEKNKIDIYDIPIAKLTDQYMAYIEKLDARDMEQLSGFLVMAATLLEIKSRMLLPVPPRAEEEEDPREALVNRLVEYKRFRKVIHALRDKSAAAQRFITRQRESVLIGMLRERTAPGLDELLGGLTAEGLYAIYEDAMNRRELKTDDIRGGFRSVVKDRHTVREKMEHVQALLRARGSVEFMELFPRSAAKAEIVVTFLAVLELARLNEIGVRQDRVFARIEISLVGGDPCHDDNGAGSHY